MFDNLYTVSGHKSLACSANPTGAGHPKARHTLTVKRVGYTHTHYYATCECGSQMILSTYAQRKRK